MVNGSPLTAREGRVLGTAAAGGILPSGLLDLLTPGTSQRNKKASDTDFVYFPFIHISWIVTFPQWDHSKTNTNWDYIVWQFKYLSFKSNFLFKIESKQCSHLIAKKFYISAAPKGVLSLSHDRHWPSSHKQVLDRRPVSGRPSPTASPAVSLPEWGWVLGVGSTPFSWQSLQVQCAYLHGTVLNWSNWQMLKNKTTHLPFKLNQNGVLSESFSELEY